MFKQLSPLLTALAVALSVLVPGKPALAQGEPKSNQFCGRGQNGGQVLQYHILSRKS